MKTVILFLLFFLGVNLQSCSTNNEPVKPDNPEEEIKDDNEGQEEDQEKKMNPRNSGNLCLQKISTHLIILFGQKRLMSLGG